MSDYQRPTVEELGSIEDVTKTWGKHSRHGQKKDGWNWGDGWGDDGDSGWDWGGSGREKDDDDRGWWD